MCDRKLNQSFRKQSSNTLEKIKTSKTVIDYQDPTLFQNITFYSSGLTTTSISGEILLELDDEICNYGNYVEAKGILSIDSLKTGPYETKGGILSFRRLYFMISKLVIPIQLRYNYDPNTVCNGNPVPENNRVPPKENVDLSGNKIMIRMDPNKDVIFSDFISTNGEDINNRNLLMENLKSFFLDRTKGFTPFFESITIGINEETALGKLVDMEMKRILCDQIININFQEKFDHIRNMNLESVILMKRRGS
jgi:hypothetical protein